MNIDAPSAVIVIDTGCSDAGDLSESRENIINFCQSRNNVKLIIVSDWINAIDAFKGQYDPRDGLPLLKFPNGWQSANNIFSTITDPQYSDIANYWKAVNGQLPDAQSKNILLHNFNYATGQHNLEFLPFIEVNGRLVSLDSMPLTPDQTLVNSWTIPQLQYIFNVKFKDIENVYFFGGSWNECLHYRPVGIVAFYRALTANLFDTNKKILTKLDCVYSRAGNLTGTLDNRIKELCKITPGPEWKYHQQHDIYELTAFPLVRSRDQRKLVTEINLIINSKAKETKSSN